MDIIELLQHVGAENIQLQNLDDSLVRADLKKHDGEITFATDRGLVHAMALNRCDKVGLILWLPKDRMPDQTDKTEPGGSSRMSCSASFGERLTAAISRRQVEIGVEADQIIEIFRTKDHPEQHKWIMEMVNQLTAGLGLCYLSGLTLENVLEPWVKAIERRHAELNTPTDTRENQS